MGVLATTLLRLQRREPWFRLGANDPGRQRERHPEPVGQWPGRAIS
ncbi:hypothetical protein [Streptomyces coffeae]|uniref:Uncharacterized protein n=1 Tax=Streptomyces coffeae TaxID=621382 RepID=A0ABS1NHD6_9ACTN|nr:hypothetical protein [Streptomyces coffeae]MBL1099486.1 hypothetical protein [Streptomyces coffeae]